MKSRPVLFFYILVIYVFASFTWWTFLLLKKNADAFSEKIALEKILHDRLNNLPDSSQDYYQTKNFEEIKNRFERQKYMIASEGVVFLILLAFGSFQLWKTFNKEINLARQQNNFLLSITHELKSPLASMKLSLQTLLKRATLDDKFKKLVDNSVEDVDRLAGMVDNILYAARMEDASYSLNSEMENLSKITDELLEKLRATYREEATISTNIGENILLETDRFAFTSAVVNLVENAIKYSGKPATVDVSLQKNDGMVTLKVKDQGAGIPAKERANVFKKFYRIGNEETRNAKGTGLGLFIVKKIVDLHHGKISVSDNQPRGTIVKIAFPA